MSSSRAAVIVLFSVVTVDAQAPPRDLAPPQARTASIRGRVIAAADGSPLRKARVHLSSAGDERDPVFTDDEGRFEFDALPSGRYTLSAAKSGYTATTFGAHRFLDRARPIVLTDGALADRIEVRLPKGAAITGRVIDDLGDPLMGINVTAGRVVGSDGRRRLVSAASAQTDDLGEYRLAGLAAGQYLVKVSSGPTSGEGVFFGGPNAGGSTWSPQYYPSTASLVQAQPISVRAGDERPAIDFQLAPTYTPTLTIGVTDSLGQPAAGIFTLVSTSSYDALNRSGSLEDGYAWTGASPGDWMLVVRGRQGVAFTPVTIDSDDVSVMLVTKPAGRMTGRVVYEGATRSRATGITLEAIPQDDYLGRMANLRAAATMNRDDTFTLSDLIGPRRFRLRGAPPGVRLKSLTLRGQSLLDGPVTFSGGEAWAGVVAVITDAHAELRGSVIDHGDTPLADYSVLVFPEDRARWIDPSRWLRWVRPSQTGTFSVDDLPTGRYLAVAVNDVDGATWSDHTFLESLRANATTFALEERGTTTLTLRLVSAP